MLAPLDRTNTAYVRHLEALQESKATAQVGKKRGRPKSAVPKRTGPIAKALDAVCASSSRRAVEAAAFDKCCPPGRLTAADI